MTSSRITKLNNENRYTWYECSCCPYGYHIDLDFVRYCESIFKTSDRADRTGSIKRRKDRRSQRQSMEVLLGITPPPQNNIEYNHQPIKPQENTKLISQTTTDSKKQPFLHDDFDDAVSDFEKTLQRSKNKGANYNSTITPFTDMERMPSMSSIYSTSNSSMTVLPNESINQREREFDTVSIESCGLSPIALQNIREQMALSLERIKELEDQVKLVPNLKEKLAASEREVCKLNLKLKESETSRMNMLNANYITPQYSNRLRSQSFTELDSVSKKEPPPVPPRKDSGVMCVVLTRNVGVGHQNPNTKSVSTSTLSGEFDHSDKWYNEKVKFLNQFSSNLTETKNVISQSTQTLSSKGKEKRNVGIQTLAEKVIHKTKVDGFTQTLEDKRSFKSVGVSISPTSLDVSVQKSVKTVTVGVSNDSIKDIVCEKCDIIKKTVGVGPESVSDSSNLSISLASLTVPRSKSFNLGEDNIDFTKRHRTVACQHEYNTVTRSCQYEVKTHSRSCQHDMKFSEKDTQYENYTVSKNTDTKDLLAPKKSVACEAILKKPSTLEIGVNTDVVEKLHTTICSKCKSPDKPSEVDKNAERNLTIDVKKEEKYSEKPDKGKEAMDTSQNKEGGSPTVSRIPRPQIPTTPVEVRKLRRQDTYTKVYESADKSLPVSPSSTVGLPIFEPYTSSQHLTSSITEKKTSNPLEKKSISMEATPFKLVDIPSNLHQNGFSPPTLVQVKEITVQSPEVAQFPTLSDVNRKKYEPSNEMRGAMKVLNDVLHKSHSKNITSSKATQIVQEEWFKVSSLATANPLIVEDYLDTFEDISSVLLEYVVNMTDTSGNTAMHYAVSHGNFDVVSILLDSKVCDINKPNKAGYTSVMLVSLAKVKSQTDANVIRRLFQLADVNIRAKLHGQTALMLAVSHGRLDMVKLLLEAGADINIQDEDGSTALMCAAEHGHIEIVKHFLSQTDCDITITDVDGSTALKIAMEAGHRHIGVLLYAHERNLTVNLETKPKKSKSYNTSPKPPTSPLPSTSNFRALTDTKSTK